MVLMRSDIWLMDGWSEWKDELETVIADVDSWSDRDDLVGKI